MLPIAHQSSLIAGTDWLTMIMSSPSYPIMLDVTPYFSYLTGLVFYLCLPRSEYSQPADQR